MQTSSRNPNKTHDFTSAPDQRFMVFNNPFLTPIPFRCSPTIAASTAQKERLLWCKNELKAPEIAVRYNYTAATFSLQYPAFLPAPKSCCLSPRWGKPGGCISTWLREPASQGKLKCRAWNTCARVLLPPPARSVAADTRAPPRIWAHPSRPAARGTRAQAPRNPSAEPRPDARAPRGSTFCCLSHSVTFPFKTFLKALLIPSNECFKVLDNTVSYQQTKNNSDLFFSPAHKYAGKVSWK